MRFLCFWTILLFAACSHSQEDHKVGRFYLGDTWIDLVEYRSDTRGPLYYNMHDDENTSADVAREMVEEYGGVLYEVMHTGRRNIEFMVDSVRYEIDPNRIYSDTGIWKELRRVALRDSVLMAGMIRAQDSLALMRIRDSLYQAGDSLLFLHLQRTLGQTPVVIRDGSLSIRLPMEALRYNGRDSMVFEKVRIFAKSILDIMHLDEQPLVIALHNNTNNNYSMDSYCMDQIYQDEALAVYRGLHPDPDDFYFVTERRIFEALQPNHYHIVLQDNEKMTDDGSLSVYCGQRGIHYVNVEAQHRHEKEQKEMLEVLLERLLE